VVKPPAGARALEVVVDAERARAKHTWGVAEEAAVEINVNGEPLAVMMATPVQLDDLAVGFAFTEGVLADAAAELRVDVQRYAEGWIADLQAPSASINEQARRARLLEGRAGCGLCGVESLAAAMRRPLVPQGAPAERVADAALRRAFDELPRHQVLNQFTHSVHAAAWCSPDGAIEAVREDVGRHNALDKLAGWLLRAEPAHLEGFVVMSSRLSFELVCKSAAMGAALLAAASAPTTLALEIAAQAKLPLACVNGDGAVARFES